MTQVNKHHDIKRLIIISDTHFGVRSNSVEWQDIQYDYFKNWFIPLIKRNYKEGDALIHLGDAFDSRQTVNIKVMNMGLDIFKSISDIMPVFIFVGNHDIYFKKSNDVNSLKPLTFINNINVYEEPVVLEFNSGKTSALLMPWQDTKESEQEYIDSNNTDYLFCHTDISGLKFNSVVDILDGNTISMFSKYKRVYSGHIHYAQNKNNIRMVGCPYQLTRSDFANNKGIWYLDLDTDKETYYQNNYSPQFVKLELSRILEMPYGTIKEQIRNNFVDVLVQSSRSMDFPFNLFLEAFSDIEYRKLNYIITTVGIDDEIYLDDDELANYEMINIPNLIDLYIDGLSYKEEIKERLKDTSKKLYFNILQAEDSEI